MQTLLTPAARELLQRERALLERLVPLLERLDADAERQAGLGEMIASLEALFLVVVVGEFNAGKSSFLNALFGETVAEEGPIPTTAKITILRHGEAPLTRQLSEFVVERQHPAPLLRNLSLVDTPGTNSIVQRHQEITEGFIPRADLVLFLTSFDRPLTESERQFLSFVREDWGKRLVFVLNKIDLAESEAALEQVLAYLRSSLEEALGQAPQIFPIAAQQARRAKASGDDALWRASRFEALETFLQDTLAGPEQLALKLGAPLDTADQLLRIASTALQARRQVVGQDEARLAEIGRHLDERQAETRASVQHALSEIDNLLLEMERRGVQFLEDNIRVSKLRLLKDRDRFKEEFRRQVLRESARQIEDRITEAVDGLLRHLLELWNWTLGRFREAKPDGPGGASFQYNRAEVFDKIRRQAEERLRSYDLDEEARRILENSRNAAALFLGAEGVAAGIGAIATVIIATTAADVTGGFIAAGAIAVFGFVFLPRQKRRAIGEFRERVEALRTELRRGLTEQFDREADAGFARVRTLVQPYADLVEEEQQALAEAAETRDAARAEVDALRKEVEATFGVSSV